MFKEIATSELREIIGKYTERTQFKNYKSKKREDLLIELQNRFILYNGRLMLKYDAENARHRISKNKVITNKSVIDQLSDITMNLNKVVGDLL
jgi:hypothetical protein